MTAFAPGTGLGFHRVNRPGQPGYCTDMQRHHILPRQVRRYPSLMTMLHAIDPQGRLMGDFGWNGLLLPATDALARRTHLPLHRGPHRVYSDLVLTRMARIETHWHRRCGPMPNSMAADARWRLRLLQSALARSLIDPQARPHVPLNQRDPFRARTGPQDTSIDDLAAMLWIATRAGA